MNFTDDGIVNILRLRIRELQGEVSGWKRLHTEVVQVNNRYLEENRRLKSILAALESATPAYAAADSTIP